MKPIFGLASLLTTSTILGASLLTNVGSAQAARFDGDDLDVNFTVFFSANSIDFTDSTVSGGATPTPNTNGVGTIVAGSSGDFVPFLGDTVSITDLCNPTSTPFGCNNAAAGSSPIDPDTVVGGKIVDWLVSSTGQFAIDLDSTSFTNVFTSNNANASSINVRTSFTGWLRDTLMGGPALQVEGFFTDNFSDDANGAGFFTGGGAGTIVTPTALFNGNTFVSSGGNADFQVAVVPEPSTIIGSVLFALFGGGSVLKKRRQQNA